MGSKNKKNTTKVQKKEIKTQQEKAGKQSIDDLFSQVKVQKKIQKENIKVKLEQQKKEQKKEKKEKQEIKIDKSLPFDQVAAKGEKRRKTSDGYDIYTTEELNVGKGGDTELCPFDCDCCF